MIINNLKKFASMKLLFIHILIFSCFYSTVLGQNSEEYYEQSKKYLRENAFGPAFEAINKYLELQPQAPKGYLTKGLIEYKSGNPLGAITNFDKAISLNPRYLEAYYNRALLRAGMKQDSLAVIDFSKIIEIEPQSPPAVFFERAKAYFNLQKIEASLQDFSQTIKLNPASAIAYQNRARIYYLQKKNDLALADLKLAIQYKPNYEDALDLRSHIYWETQQYALMLNDIDILLKMNPYNWSAFLKRGIVLVQQNQMEAALKDFNRVIEKKAEGYEAEAYLQRGKAYLVLKNKELACADFAQALSFGHLEAESLKNENCK
jgi:tetratricopeptide (TPR) repeat protein